MIILLSKRTAAPARLDGAREYRKPKACYLGKHSSTMVNLCFGKEKKLGSLIWKVRIASRYFFRLLGKRRTQLKSRNIVG